MTEAAVELELDAQYRAMREGAGVLDRSERGKLEVKGAEAAEYLQGQLTNDIEALAPNEGCYAALLDRKGHVQADMRLLRLADDELWLDLEPAATESALKHLRTYSVGRELSIQEVSGDWAITSVIGPAAPTIAGYEGLGPEHAQRFRDSEGLEVLGVSTNAGVDLITRSDQAEQLRDRLAEAGAETVSASAAEILRVESGRPRFGFELGPEVMPAEAGIVERAVDFEKGCYIGQEPVARLHYRGKPNRLLRGLRLETPAERGVALRLGERELGTIGTACVSPAHGPIALAVLRKEAEVGERVEVGSGGSAEVAELPFT